MSTDIDFVKFVRQRKHAKPDMEDLYEIDFLGRKKEGISFNDTIRNDVKKPKLQEGESSLSDFLTKNKDKIIEEPKKEEKIKGKESEEEEENDVNDEKGEKVSDNESDDYSEEKINHFIGGEKNNVDEMQEIINEIKNSTEMIKNKRNKKDKKDKKNKKEKKDKKDKKIKKEEINLEEDDSDNDNDNKETQKRKKKKEKHKVKDNKLSEE